MQTRTIGTLTVLLPAEADEIEETSDVSCEHCSVVDRLVTGVVWSRAHLAGVTLSRCRLVNADLSSTVFDEVTMDRCILRGCSLVGARLASVTMKNVIFETADSTTPPSPVYARPDPPRSLAARSPIRG